MTTAQPTQSPLIRDAIATGWRPTPPKTLTAYPCKAGCGRTYTAQAGDETEHYLRMNSFICLDCRHSLKAHRRTLARANKRATRAHSGTAPPDDPQGLSSQGTPACPLSGAGISNEAAGAAKA